MGKRDRKSILSLNLLGFRSIGMGISRRNSPAPSGIQYAAERTEGSEDPRYPWLGPRPRAMLCAVPQEDKVSTFCFFDEENAIPHCEGNRERIGVPLIPMKRDYDYGDNAEAGIRISGMVISKTIIFLVRSNLRELGIENILAGFTAIISSRVCSWTGTRTDCSGVSSSGFVMKLCPSLFGTLIRTR
jgi:hypothetical protein